MRARYPQLFSARLWPLSRKGGHPDEVDPAVREAGVALLTVALLVASTPRRGLHVSTATLPRPILVYKIDGEPPTAAENGSASA